MGLIIFIAILLIYLVVPAPVQLIIFIGNLLLPDSVPLVDELVMGFGLVKNLSSIANVLDWISEHKGTCVIIGIIAFLIIVSII
ncbi:MAG: hypothetical protein IJZ95_07200 [Oscillospiraceae bacterium]|nr:hypothetical protein [Oscillospiraceae bacterium]